MPGTRAQRRRTLGLAAGLTMALLLVSTGCVESRDRPDLTGPETTGPSTSEVAVELTKPTGEESFFIRGREIEIQIRGADEGGRLKALGYEIRRSEFLRTMHVEEAAFALTSAAERSFTYVPPDTLPSPIRLVIRGYARGPNDLRTYTEFQDMQVLHCPPDAVWC